MDLRRIFDNYFQSRHITDGRLRKFVEDHIQRLKANNTEDELTEMIDKTVALYLAFQNAITDEDAKVASQRSLTRSKDQAVKDFKSAVSLKEKIIQGTWGTGSPEYKAFFPNGLKEYSNANLVTAETLMTRFINTATAHVDTLGQPFVDQFTQLKDEFVAARTAQLQQFGEVAESKSTTLEKRTALETQLTGNVHNLALKFLGDPKRGMDFFDQSIIRRRFRRESVEETVDTPVE